MIAEECTLAEGVQVKGPTALGARCKIAKGAVVEGVVLWDGVQVGETAVLRNCVVGSHSSIREGCYIPEGCVLGDNVRLDSGFKMANVTRVEPDTCLS